MMLFLLPAQTAWGGPVLVEDDRWASAWAHASDLSGDGPFDGPNVVSLDDPGALFSGVASAGSVGDGLGTVVAAGAQQLSYFQAGDAWTFRADGIAQADTLTPPTTLIADGGAETGLRLVFTLHEDTAYELSGSLGIFLSGGVSGASSVSLRAADGVGVWFEEDSPVEFHSAGVLEEGTWVLELSASVSSTHTPGGLDSTSAAAQFRDVVFTLTPAPPGAALMLAAGALASRRRRR